MPFAPYNDFMPHHANRTSFKKGQKNLTNGKKMGRQKGIIPWNKGKKIWPNGLPDNVKQQISNKLKGRKPVWLPSYNTKHVIKRCLKCDKEFSCIPFKANTRQFCSHNCSNSSRPKPSIKIIEKIRTTNTERGHYERHRLRMKNGGAVKARLANFPPSRFQKEVFNEVKSIYPDAKMEHSIDTKSGVKLADIYIPSKHLVIECDGYYWHKDKQELDAIRQSKIETLGYRVSRIPELEWKNDKNIFRYL